MFNFNNTKIPKFRRFVLQNFPFIEQDFDALTDYALICKVVEFLNKVIDQTNLTTQQVAILTDAFNQLKEYVDNYFDNLDVQEEINNKLDQMVEDGTLQEIITQYIQANVAWTFDNVAEMKSATNLVNGSYAKTIGFYSANDGGGALYKIVESTPSTYYETLNSGLYAELVPENDTILTKQFGIVGDGTTDETNKLINFFSYDIANYIINSPDILIDNDIPLSSNSTITFNEGCKITRKTNNLTTYFMFLIDNKHTQNKNSRHVPVVNNT